MSKTSQRKAKRELEARATAVQSVEQKLVRQQIIASFSSGPLPPPDVLAAYNNALPNGAERIVAMAERQQQHRMGLENRALHWDIVRSNAGLAAGLIVALGGLTASYFLIDGGHGIEGSGIAVLDLGSIVGTFVYGTVNRRNERKERIKMMTGQFN